MARRMHDQDEHYDHPLEPLTIMPAQFFTAVRQHAARNGEKRLIVAILEDAVSVYLRHREPTTSKQRRIFRDTERWLRSRDREWVFSFERICEMLDLDPSTVRRGLRRRREAITGKPAPLVPVHLPPSRRVVTLPAAPAPIGTQERELQVAVG